jgi:HNH endonuclease
VDQPKPGSPEDPCEEYRGAKRPSGHGNRNFRGIPMLASRAAWIEANGPVPDGLWVLHRCDNPPCVKVSHLYLGTPQDNVRDMWERGNPYSPGPNGVGMATRFGPGSSHWRAKLTESDVRRMRARNAEGADVSTLAAEFEMSPRQVLDIVRRKAWRHVE